MINEKFCFVNDIAGTHSAVRGRSDTRARGSRFDTRKWPVRPFTFVSPSADSRRVVVCYQRNSVHYTAEPLGGQSLPRNSVVRLTDRADMATAVYCERKQ